jgi:hypothetical protein
MENVKHSSRVEQIRSDIERRIPGAFKVYGPSRRNLVHTGNSAEQQQSPKGGLIEICARERSAGTATVLRRLAAAITRRRAFCAVIDAGDSFDPTGAALAGVELDRLLWVRCQRQAGTGKTLTPLEQAFKAADILIQNGGFELIAVDLASIPEPALRKVPLTTWFRFARVAEKTECALVFFSTYPAARSCATFTLQLTSQGATWAHATAAGRVPHGRVLTSVNFRLDSECRETRKPVQPVQQSGNDQVAQTR